MGGVQVQQAPRGLGVERGYPPPHKGLGRELCLLTISFRIFVENTLFGRFLTRLFLKS